MCFLRFLSPHTNRRSDVYGGNAANRRWHGVWGAYLCNLYSNTCTLWKINMEPENDGLEDDFPPQLGDF